MANYVVLMTALVPTVGHKYLIDFANSLCEPFDKVHVILNSLPSEPVAGQLRYNALVKTYANNPNVVIHWLHKDVPQNPADHPNFWEVWRDIVLSFVSVTNTDYFVASEHYGIDMAKVLGCTFIPCNIYRETLPVKGTSVRRALPNSFAQVMPAFQNNLRLTVTLFGPESCGKTTMAKWLAESVNGWFIPEWAREYLETVGIEITKQSMKAIQDGQFALQKTASMLENRPFVVQDTDLYSTLGYYELWGNGSDHDLDLCEYRANKTASDLYILMNDGIPFEVDPIRYGGNKRESTTQYWEDLLNRYKLPYYKVVDTDLDKQRVAVYNYVLNFYKQKFSKIVEYER